VQQLRQRYRVVRGRHRIRKEDDTHMQLQYVQRHNRISVRRRLLWQQHKRNVGVHALSVVGRSIRDIGGGQHHDNGMLYPREHDHD